MFKQLLNEAISSLLPVIATALSLGLVWLGKTLNAWLTAKVKNERLSLITNRLVEVVTMVVLELQQTTVNDLKLAFDDSSEGGRKLTKHEGDVLIRRALVKVKTYLGADGLKLLCYVVGLKTEYDMDSFIVSRIEATLHTVKLRTPTVLTTIAEPVKLPSTSPGEIK